MNSETRLKTMPKHRMRLDNFLRNCDLLQRNVNFGHVLTLL